MDMIKPMRMSAGLDGGNGRVGGRFRIGDVVRNGMRVATVTDVGTVLVAVTTTMGASRMVCPWELVPLRTAADDPGFGAAPQ
jgi:hypothetical protein